jgi:hypothetical protein
VPFGSLLASGINNINKISSTVNQFNSGLTQGQQGLTSITNNPNSPLNNLREITTPFGEIDQVFQGQIEKLSRSNIIQGVQGVSNISNNVANSPTLNGIFKNDAISSTLNGIRQNISVVSPAFGVAVDAISNVSSAVNFISDAINLGSQALSDLSNFPLVAGGNRPDSKQSIFLTRSDTGEAAVLPNPLREYASYNYIIELAVLSPGQLNSPEDSYRVNLTNSILRSGGGNLNRRVTTFDEDTFGSHAEYFIDDIEINALMTPNKQTGVTQGTGLEFTVTEPYSMGKFLEALQIGAFQAGYDNYIEAPFVLKISFIGFDQNGNVKSDLAAPPKFFPIKITNIDFDLKGEGSYYQCKGIPYNQIALLTQTSVVRTDVTLNGRTLVEALETGNPNTPNIPSLTKVLNDRSDTFVSAGVYTTPDRYIIMFPTDSQGATAVVSDARDLNFSGVNSATQNVTIDPGLASAAGISATQTVSVPEGGVYATLKQYAMNNVNKIGKSVIIDNIAQDGDQNFASHSGSYDEAGLNLRPEVQAEADETARNYMYTQNTAIPAIIEDMVINSEYGRALSEQNAAEEGLKEWFRIETQVFLEEDPYTQAAKGTPPKIYVYSVVPYFPDESRFQGPSRRSSNTAKLRSLALKEYNYYYTGKNEDVLDFNINFKTAFFQNLFADLGQHSAAFRSGVSGETINVGEVAYTQLATPASNIQSSGELSEPGVPIEEIIKSSDSVMGGTRTSQSVAGKRAIAQAFQDTLINSNVDLVNAEMDIWGDPFFIPESGVGNYNAAPSGINPNLTADGTVTGQHSDVFVNVNFRTPFDYKGEKMVFSNIVKPFSGIYMVTKIRNRFSGGRFTQSLTMIRKRGQNDEGTGFTDVITTGNKQVLTDQPAQDIGTSGNPNNTGARRRFSIGYGSGQVDPALARAAGLSSGTGANGESVPVIGYGIGQIDPALAAAAGLTTSNNAAPPTIGYGAGQIDPALARAAGINSTILNSNQSVDIGYGAGQIDPALAAAANISGSTYRSRGNVPIKDADQAEIDLLRQQRNEIDIRMIEIENQGMPANLQAEYDRLLTDLRSKGKRLIELGALGTVTINVDAGGL